VHADAPLALNRPGTHVVDVGDDDALDGHAYPAVHG
jgi:hypothetical protein